MAAQRGNAFLGALVLYFIGIYLRDAMQVLSKRVSVPLPSKTTGPETANNAEMGVGRQPELTFDDFEEEEDDELSATPTKEQIAERTEFSDDDDSDDFEAFDDDVASSEFDDPDFEEPRARPPAASAGRRRKLQRGKRGGMQRGKRGTGSAGVHEMLVQFCTSWAYKGNFIKLKEFLERRYPELQGNIRGMNFPAHPLFQLVATVAGFLQLFGMLFVFFGQHLFSMLGLPEPMWYSSIKDNKMMAFGAIFIFNTFAQNLVATGAFEVHYNGERIFSKLESGYMPDADHLVRLLETHGLSE